MNCLSSPPRMIGSRGTQTKLVCRIVKSLCAKFGAFFRSVTIFSLNHLTIRQAGVQYLSNNPERFFESNTENSWNECINIMSMQGTWCNALFVQAVADCQNAVIHIIEPHKNLAGETLIEPHYLAQHPSTTIY